MLIFLFVVLVADILLLVYRSKQPGNYKLDALSQFVQALLWCLLAIVNRNGVFVLVLCCIVITLFSLYQGVKVLWNHKKNA